MIYWMTSKTFRDEFLIKEKYKDILETQYVLISSRIGYSGKEENIISAKSFLFPSPHTCSAATNDEFINRYEEQLKNNIAFFAMIIQNALIENNDIVLLCTKCENKMKFMDVIVDFVYHKFGYFIYNYKKYSKGVLKEYKFNKTKVLLKCDKYIQDVKKNSSDEKVRKSYYKDLSKKELRMILEKEGIYSKNKSRKEMIDDIEVFIL